MACAVLLARATPSGSEAFRRRQAGVAVPHLASVEGFEGVQQDHAPFEEAVVVLGCPQCPVEVVAARSRIQAHDSSQAAEAGAALARVKVGGERPPRVSLRDHGRFFVVGRAGRCRSRDFGLAMGMVRIYKATNVQWLLCNTGGSDG